MDDKQLPAVFTHESHVVAAARAGMRLKAIAARANMRKRDFDVLLEANEELAIKIEQAYADYEQEARDEIEVAKRMALSTDDAALYYKIAKEKVKELRDADVATKVIEVSDDDTGNGAVSLSLSIVIAKANRDPNTGATLGEPTVTPLSPEKGSGA